MTLSEERSGACLRSFGGPDPRSTKWSGSTSRSRGSSPSTLSQVQRLFHAIQEFLGTNDAKVPFIIGIGGSVAVGEIHHRARVLRELFEALAFRNRRPTSSPPTGFFVPERRAEGRRADGAKGLSGELRCFGAALPS